MTKLYIVDVFPEGATLRQAFVRDYHTFQGGQMSIGLDDCDDCGKAGEAAFYPKSGVHLCTKCHLGQMGLEMAKAPA